MVCKAGMKKFSHPHSLPAHLQLSYKVQPGAFSSSASLISLFLGINTEAKKEFYISCHQEHVPGPFWLLERKDDEQI